MNAAFQRAMDQIHQYPTCEKLIYTVIFYLDGARFLHGVPNPDAYTDRLIPFYESMSHSQTQEIRDAALAMCIAYHRNRKDFTRAEELINTIPSTRIDKEEQLATLYTQQEKWEDAQRLWERRTFRVPQSCKRRCPSDGNCGKRGPPTGCPVLCGYLSAGLQPAPM